MKILSVLKSLIYYFKPIFPTQQMKFIILKKINIDYTQNAIPIHSPFILSELK